MTKAQFLLKSLITILLIFSGHNILSQTQIDSLENHSVLCIYRPHKFYGQDIGLNIKLNEQPIGIVASGLRVNYKIFSEGKISFMYFWAGQSAAPPVQKLIEVENGKYYYIRLDLAAKSDDEKIKLVSEDVAKKEMAEKKAIKSTIELSENINTPIASSSKRQKSGPKSATGFLIGSEGYIVTNHHVIDGAKKIIIRGVNGNLSNEYSARVVCQDKNNDLAIIKVDGVKFDSIPFILGPSTLKTGEEIFTMGYPLTTELGEEIKLTNGVISSNSGFQNDITSYQVSSPVQPGNSGGPLFDKNGNLIGIINAKYQGAENVSYAIKIIYLNALLELCPETIKLNAKNRISGKTLPDQASIAKNFIFIIEVNKK